MIARLWVLILLRFCVLPLPGLADTPPQPQPEGIDPATVVVLANASNEDSVRVARTLLELREIPEENLIALPLSDRESISREQFHETIHNPLLKELIERDLVKAIPGDIDAFGRQQVMLQQSPLRYLVTTYKVPVHIRENRELDDSGLLDAYFSGHRQRWRSRINESRLSRNEASVDAELALLLLNDMPMTGFVLNPFFHRVPDRDETDLLKVTRLDGPSANAVIKGMRGAIEVEETGLKGRAYVDEDARGGSYTMGNRWLEVVAEMLTTEGFDVQHDKERETFQSTDRFDFPAIYAGWYTRSVNGPFKLEGFAFPPGAIAVHIHSGSAAPLRHPENAWVGPFVQRGAAATLGNTAEPILSLSHYYDIFFSFLLDGFPFADAAAAALPVLSWQGVAVGDPFYQPFKVSLDEQRKALADGPLDSPSDTYVLARLVQHVHRNDSPAKARRLAREFLSEAPGPAIALLVAQLDQLAGDEEAAIQSLRIMDSMHPAQPAEAGLFGEIADSLNELKQYDLAARIVAGILRMEKLPRDLRLFFLKKGIPIAEASSLSSYADNWRTELAELTESSQPE